MIEQTELFSRFREETVPLPRPSAETTRRDADRAIARPAKSIRLRILEFIRRRGAEGATDQEIAAHFGLSGDTVRPRRVELRDMGLLFDSGKTRKTASGQESVVWVASRPTD